LVQLEEDLFVTGFHQQVQKEKEKAWHDRHIKPIFFQVGELVLLYDSKFMQHPRKFQMHWLGPYVIKHVTEAGAVQLETLNGEVLRGLSLLCHTHPCFHEILECFLFRHDLFIDLCFLFQNLLYDLHSQSHEFILIVMRYLLYHSLKSCQFPYYPQCFILQRY
jgi:hypothetical protein